MAESNAPDWPAHLPPLGPMAPIPYVMSYTASEFARMRQGFAPRDMDDRWAVYYAGDELRFYRTWGGPCIYWLQCSEHDNLYHVAKAMVATGGGYRRMPDAEEVAFLDRLIRVVLLGDSDPRSP